MALNHWARRLFISSTVTQGVIYIVRPMMTYRALELHATPSTVGVIAALYALLPVLMALTFGRWVGTLGEGRFVFFGTLGLILSTLSLLLANSIPMLALSAALGGTAHLACMVGGQTMVSLRSPVDRYEANFGYYTFSASLGQMLGPILATLAAGSMGVIPASTTRAFALALLFAVLALAPVLKWRDELPTVIAHANPTGTLRSAGKLLRNRKVFVAIYTSMAISSVGDILIVFLPLYGTEREFSSFSIGLIIAIRAGASMLSRLSLGSLSKRYSARQILLTSNIVSVAMCALMGIAANPWLLGALVLVAGFSLGVGQPLTMSLVSLATAPGERALAVSARLTGNRLGQFLIPAGAGALAASSGTSGVFIALSILLASTFLAS
jgi:MFS family permease